MDKNTNKAGEVLTDDQAREFIQGIKVDQIQQVYSGRQGCMCGCRGTYSVHPAHKAEADKDRGYEQPAARTTAQISKVLARLKSDPRTRIDNGHILFLTELEEGERNYVVYLCKSAAI